MVGDRLIDVLVDFIFILIRKVLDLHVLDMHEGFLFGAFCAAFVALLVLFNGLLQRGCYPTFRVLLIFEVGLVSVRPLLADNSILVPPFRTLELVLVIVENRAEVGGHLHLRVQNRFVFHIPSLPALFAL